MNGVLSIDAGLSTVKAACFTEDGTRLALAEEPNDAVRNRGAASDMDADRLWERICDAVSAVTARLPAGLRLLGVGLSGHGNGLYLVGGDGRPLHAITSMDLRAQSVVDGWQRDGRADALLKATGGHPWAGQPLPLLRFLQDGPGLPDDATLLFCKDWIRYRLTGERVTDRCEASAAGLLAPAEASWCPAVFTCAGLPRAETLLPRLVHAFEPAGAVTAAAAAATGLPAGTPVFGGSIDLALSALGDGLADPGSLHVTAGTWSIHQYRADTPAPRAGCLQVLVAPLNDGFHQVDSSPSSGVNLGVLSGLLGGEGEAEGVDAWDAAVARTPLGPDDPLYLPYPAGAWDLPTARAGWRRLGLGCGRDRLIAAVYEGIVFGHCRQVDVFRTGGTRLEELLVCGGMTRSAAWCRLLAAHSRLRVTASGDPHSGLWGAALCVLHGCGQPAPPRPGAGRERRYDPADLEVCRARYDMFLSCVEDERRWT